MKWVLGVLSCKIASKRCLHFTPSMQVLLLVICMNLSSWMKVGWNDWEVTWELDGPMRGLDESLYLDRRLIHILTTKSICTSGCKIFLLFYNTNLLFLFYITNLQNHQHQIIYNTHSFIYIILSHIFFNYYFTYTRPTTLPHTHSLSLFFFFSFFFLLLSSSTFFLLWHLLLPFFFFFFCYSFFLLILFFFSKKNLFLFLPPSLSIKLVLSSNLKKKIISHTFSLMAAASIPW